VLSADAGRTWSQLKVLTGNAQQTASVVEINGTLLCVFSHKDFAVNPEDHNRSESYGQRLILSYDGGISWTNKIFELNHGGMCECNKRFVPFCGRCNRMRVLTTPVVTACADASTVALHDGTLVSAFGYTRPPHHSGSMGVLRWRLPSLTVASEEGFFTPPPVIIPTMAPPPRGLSHWPKRSQLPPVPKDMPPIGYAECTTGGICDWEVYAPVLVPWPADLATTPTAIGGVTRPLLIRGGANGSQVLVAGEDGLYISADDARSFSLLCRWPPTVEASAASAIGLLADGVILVAAAYGSKSATAVVRGVPASGSGCKWSQPSAVLPMMWAGDMRQPEMQRFVEDTASGEVLVGLSEHNAALNQTEVVVYASIDGGRSFELRTTPGGVGEFTSRADIVIANDSALVASVKYERTQQSTGPSHNQTGIVRSLDRGRTWSAVGLVTGWKQQPGCLVSLSDGILALVFSGLRSNTTSVELILSYDSGISWSNTVFQLAKFGASTKHGVSVPTVFTAGRSAVSVALGGGPSMLTAFSTSGRTDLHLLRWSVPSRAVVNEGGFFMPTRPG
jgi:hypothetical protein